MSKKELRPAGRPNPFEGFLLFVCILQGFLVLSGTARPTSILNLMPAPFRLLWSGLLLFGGIIALAGLYWPGNPFTGTEVKRVGLMACGFPSLAYGVALFDFGAQGYVAGATSTGFALACFWRIAQVTHALKAARRRIHNVEPHLPLDIDPAFDPFVTHPIADTPRREGG